ncbi:hypothetical protein JVT61DRAFT_12608 [Boletus reticuloceps]|uniref:Uncharacterized protein n=1 Tax=Boletus reticuloceps TaxID=495285 RepID=A0A8I2YDU0_9AGAM|nr:hypothetical protein JVT61DRAFT_12608 [Boletus reticuloceps]
MGHSATPGEIGHSDDNSGPGKPERTHCHTVTIDLGFPNLSGFPNIPLPSAKLSALGNDHDLDDINSNVQDGRKTELSIGGRSAVHEPGPHDPPGPHYESFDSSFGNFGPLPDHASHNGAPPWGNSWESPKTRVLQIVFDMLTVHETDFLGARATVGRTHCCTSFKSREESEKVQVLLCVGLAKLIGGHDFRRSGIEHKLEQLKALFRFLDDDEEVEMLMRTTRGWKQCVREGYKTELPHVVYGGGAYSQGSTKFCRVQRRQAVASLTSTTQTIMGDHAGHDERLWSQISHWYCTFVARRDNADGRHFKF